MHTWEANSLAKLVTGLWLLLLAGVIVVPVLTESPTRGDDLVRNTVRVSLGFYLVALNLMLLRPDDGRLARCCWTLAWAAYLVHLAMAFHFYHSWSHARAVEHVREVSGVGEGIYVSHLFTLLWTADVLYWHAAPQCYVRRSAWVTGGLHAFMLFVVFNGTVVYEEGPIRWAGTAAFTELSAAALIARTQRRRADRLDSF